MRPLDLSSFLPYRLSVLANRISAQLASAYGVRFGITIPEWRVMAVLGQFEGVSADFVCKKTEMDRVTVSRAVARLLRKHYIKRIFEASDRRRSRLDLAAAGRAVYSQIVPLAQRYETTLVCALDTPAIAELDCLIQKLQAQVSLIDRKGF